MGGVTVFVAVLAVVGAQPAFALAAPSAPETQTGRRLGARLVRLEADLDAQAEARDRQADAFDAAVSRIEMVNSMLIAVIALAGIGGSLLAIRWVRSLARDQVAEQISNAVGDTGREIFKAESDALAAEYDQKFADIYRQYHELVEAEQ